MKTALRQFMTARRLSLGLMLIVAAMLSITTFIPQHLDSPPEFIENWRQRHPGLLWLVDAVGLHRIYTQPWFAGTVLLAAAALAVSCADQFRIARKKLHSTAGGEPCAESVSEDRLRAAAAARGYRFLKNSPADHLKFIRNPWGYFGNPLLHAGLLMVVCASLFVALTGRQRAVVLVDGEPGAAAAQWSESDHGLLAAPFMLPGAVRLERLSVSPGHTGHPAQVTSEITIIDGSGTPETFSVAINDISRYRGTRVYHASNYGDAFALEFMDDKGNTHFEKIPVQYPVDLNSAGYGEFDLAWSPYVLSAKYYADSRKVSGNGPMPLLVMRLLDRGRELSRVDLAPGQEGMLGAYRVRLLGVQKWSKLIFVDVSGVPMVFAGFAVIILGGLLYYLAPPRELVAVRQHDRYRVFWKAPSFRDFYLEERDGVMSDLHRGSIP